MGNAWNGSVCEIGSKALKTHNILKFQVSGFWFLMPVSKTGVS